MIEQALTHLFTDYINALNNFSLDEMRACCTIPCVLHTPDKIAYLSNETLFSNEFTHIFQSLQCANVVRVSPTAASYTEVNPHLCMVSINWVFLDTNNEVYTDFSAFYHVASTELDEAFKINNVISHELTNAVALAKNLNLKNSR